MYVGIRSIKTINHIVLIDFMPILHSIICNNFRLEGLGVYVMALGLCLPHLHYLSRIVRKPAFYICENKDADQLRGNREADQHLCFRYTDSTIPLLSKSEMSSR